MVGRWLILIGCLLVGAALLAGCGGTSGADYLATLKKVSESDLRAAKASKFTWDQDSAVILEKSRTYLQFSRAQQKALQKLTPPAGFATAHSKLLTSWELGTAVWAAFVEAVEAGDTAAVQRYSDQYAQHAEELYSANAAFIEALSAAADRAGLVVPQAVYQDYPTSAETDGR